MNAIRAKKYVDKGGSVEEAELREGGWRFGRNFVAAVRAELKSREAALKAEAESRRVAEERGADRAKEYLDHGGSVEEAERRFEPDFVLAVRAEARARAVYTLRIPRKVRCFWRKMFRMRGLHSILTNQV